MAIDEQGNMRADQRITFRLSAEHKALIEREAKRRHGTQGDVLRELVREWAERTKQAVRSGSRGCG